MAEEAQMDNRHPVRRSLASFDIGRTRIDTFVIFRRPSILPVARSFPPADPEAVHSIRPDVPHCELVRLEPLAQREVDATHSVLPGHRLSCQAQCYH